MDLYFASPQIFPSLSQQHTSSGCHHTPTSTDNTTASRKFTAFFQCKKNVFLEYILCCLLPTNVTSSDLTEKPPYITLLKHHLTRKLYNLLNALINLINRLLFNVSHHSRLPVKAGAGRTSRADFDAIREETMMHAIIICPVGKTIKLQDRILAMRKAYIAICGTQASASGVVFFLKSANVDEILHIIDYIGVPYAVTSRGILKRNGEHILVDYSYNMTKNDTLEWINQWFLHVKDSMKRNELLKISLRL